MRWVSRNKKMSTIQHFIQDNFGDRPCRNNNWANPIFGLHADLNIMKFKIKKKVCYSISQKMKYINISYYCVEYKLLIRKDNYLSLIVTKDVLQYCAG